MQSTISARGPIATIESSRPIRKCVRTSISHGWASCRPKSLPRGCSWCGSCALQVKAATLSQNMLPNPCSNHFTDQFGLPCKHAIADMTRARGVLRIGLDNGLGYWELCLLETPASVDTHALDNGDGLTFQVIRQSNIQELPHILFAPRSRLAAPAVSLH